MNLSRENLGQNRTGEHVARLHHTPAPIVAASRILCQLYPRMSRFVPLQWAGT